VASKASFNRKHPRVKAGPHKGEFKHKKGLARRKRRR
jgi:hypothetical protein